jgi:hypothetical protein
LVAALAAARIAGANPFDAAHAPQNEAGNNAVGHARGDDTHPDAVFPVIVATPTAPTIGSSQTIDWHFHPNLGGEPVTAPTFTTDRAQYLNNSPATAVLAGVTPDSLLAQPSLPPGFKVHQK